MNAIIPYPFLHFFGVRGNPSTGRNFNGLSGYGMLHFILWSTPRQAPSSREASNTATQTQSYAATEAIPYKVRMLAGKSSFFTFCAARSASARLANGPTRTRVRLPSLVSATWV